MLPSETGGGRHSVGVETLLYVRGDDDDLWYTAGLTLDNGVYIWSTSGPVDLPPRTVNLSNRIVGSAFWVADPLGTWHEFNLTRVGVAGVEGVDTGYTWTDTTQITTAPAVFSRRPLWRAEDGVYVVDIDGHKIHKLGITGGIWSDLTQGYAIPL